jgi:hypothetical protein
LKGSLGAAQRATVIAATNKSALTTLALKNIDQPKRRSFLLDKQHRAKLSRCMNYALAIADSAVASR